MLWKWDLDELDETPWDGIKIYNVSQHYTKHFTLSSLEHKHFSLSGKRNDLDMMTFRYRIREFDNNFINEEKNWIVIQMVQLQEERSQRETQFIEENLQAPASKVSSQYCVSLISDSQPVFW